MVLNSMGSVVETLTGHGLNGPWDMAELQAGPLAELFVSNVLNGTVAAAGQVVRTGAPWSGWCSPSPAAQPAADRCRDRIGSGFPQGTDPAALVIGPTGLGVGANHALVADTLASRIAAIPDAMSGPPAPGAA